MEASFNHVWCIANRDSTPWSLKEATMPIIGACPVMSTAAVFDAKLKFAAELSGMHALAMSFSQSATTASVTSLEHDDVMVGTVLPKQNSFQFETSEKFG